MHYIVSKFRKFHITVIFCTILLSLNFIVRLLYVSNPLTWDEFNYFIGAMNIAKNNLNPFTLFWGYKGPVVFMPVAISMHLLGFSPVWAHVFVFFCSSYTLFIWFLLLKRKFNYHMALFGVVALAFFPLFMTQSFVYTDTIPMTALCITLLYALDIKNTILFVLTSIIMVLTKETSVLLLFAIFFIHQPKRLSSLLTLIIPLIIFAFWMIGNKIFLGWFLWPYNVSLVSTSLLSSETIYNLFLNVFIRHGVWLISLPAIGGYFILIVKKKYTSECTFYWFIYLFSGSFYFLFPFLQRYLLHLYPILFLLTINILVEFFSKRVVATILITISVVFIVLNVKYFRSPTFAEDDDLSYFKRVGMNKKIIQIIENKYTYAQIITNWPLSEALKNPAFGYVQYKHDVIGISCEQHIAITPDLFSELKPIVIVATTLNSEFHWPKDLPVLDTIKEGSEYAWIGTISNKENLNKILNLNYCQD